VASSVDLGVSLAALAVMPVMPFPHRYVIALQGDSLVATPRTSVRIGPPPEFGGTDDVWSPEHMLIGATLSCLKTTFDAYARRDKLVVLQWRGTATGVLVKGREGPVFETIDLAVELVTNPGDEARAQTLLETAERQCIISRALAVPVRVTCSATSTPAAW
jgi:organic hydroperoxide reductase OsmC/OhrA